MKKISFLLVIIGIIAFVRCEKEEQPELNNELTFSRLNYEEDNSSFQIMDVIVKYDEIVAYDSAQYVFQLDEQAWERIKGKITPIYPDPNFGFGVTIDDELIYKVAYIPGYHSYSYPDLIKFEAVHPNCIHLWLGHYDGVEKVNDNRIIELFSKDGKLKSIDLQI